MIKAVAVDDEPPALKVLTAFCNQVDFIDLQKTFTNTEDAIEYVNSRQIDLIFVDINMPAISGIDLYKKLSAKPMLILTTAFSEFAVEGFNLNAVDYLLKPFTLDRFMQAAEKARNLQKLASGNDLDKHGFITLRINYALMKICTDEVLYVEGLDDYLKIHLKQRKAVVARLTMKAMIDKLPPKDFVRVHRSFIISLRHVTSLRNKVIYIGDEEIPLSSSYEASFLALFQK